MLIGWFAMLVFAFHACTHMVAAGDTWVALACGRHFVNHGVDTVEPFSANAHEAGPTEAEVAKWPGWARKITNIVGLDTVRYWHPTGWIDQNWLTHVLFYRLAAGLGSDAKPYFDALIWWKFAVYFLIAACLYATTRLLGINRLLAVVFVCFAMFIGRSFLDVRPAGFSNLLVPVFLLILALTTYRNALYIWLIVPIVVFWSNVHGGYIYAFIALVPFVAWHVMARLPKRWTIAIYSILTWAVLAWLANQFWNELAPMTRPALPYDRMKPISFTSDWVFLLLVLSVAGSIALTVYRRVEDGAIAVFHISISVILFFLFLTRFFPRVPEMAAYYQRTFIATVDQGRNGFLGLAFFALILGAVVAVVKDRVVRTMEWKGILHTIGAGAAAFVAMVLFNPFHLTNLTHTFIISLSKQAERWRDVHEWHRAFDWANPVGTAIPFMVMYIIAWLALIVWAIASIRCARQEKPTARKKAITGEFTWPRMDIGLLILAAMTIYMAIRSRRFIPIAAYAACPIIALILQQIVTYTLTIVSAIRNGRTMGDRLKPALTETIALALGGALIVLLFWRAVLWRWLFLPVPGESSLVQPRFWLAALGTMLAFAAFPVAAFLYVGRERSEDDATRPASDWRLYLRPAAVVSLLLLIVSAVSFAGWVGAKFKRVYLDYWPSDPKLTSIFMRMTASDAKPFEACQFIRENQLSGNMFNYWTEGGAIAWGETPDPNTGRTPLQLFMDGRAQAAYSEHVFNLWSDIISGGATSGGPIQQAARAGRRFDTKGYPSLTTADYRAIGDWVADQLTKYDAWVVLMPRGQFNTPFVIGLDVSADWQIVFANDKQRLYVNIHTDKGRQLYDDVVSGLAKFPNDFSANFTRGHNLAMYANGEQRKDGYEMLIKAFLDNPSRGPMRDILNIGDQVSVLQPRLNEVCRAYVEQFVQNQAEYADSDGYNLRLAAATMALSQLEFVARRQGNLEEADAYRDQAAQYDQEARRIANSKRW